MEKSCFVPSEVWQIRVDLHLLNHNGNIIDAASIAAIAALCHFRRPDVSVQGEEVTLVCFFGTGYLLHFLTESPILPTLSWK